MKEQLFSIFKSKQPYTEKPNNDISKSLNFRRESTIKAIKEGKLEAFRVSLEQIAKMVEQGFSINASVLDTTRLLILDLDNGITEKEFSEICKKWDIVPNIYYRTFSYEKGIKEKFRAIYKLNYDYTLQEYKAIYEMLKWIFGDGALDGTSSNFKQLCHGTNKGVKLIHGKEFNPRHLGEVTGYFKHFQEEQWKREKQQQERTKRQSETKEKTTQYLTVEGVLRHFGIDKNVFHFDEAIDIYLTLRKFDLEERLILASEEKREEYFKSFERAYNSGKKPQRGSTGAKLWGALTTVLKSK